MQKPQKSGAASAQNSGLLSQARRQRERLLGALCESRAYGWLGLCEGEAVLCVAVQRKGVSVASLRAPESVAHVLLAEGLAIWEAGGASGKRRLLASDAGRAHLARLQSGDGLDPFLAQHRPLSRRCPDGAGNGAKVVFDDGESPLAWLARRKGRDGLALIDATCLAAGERLRSDLTLAQMLPRVTANWSASATGGKSGAAGESYSDMVIAARQRVDRALAAAGPELSGILVDVCGFLKGLEMIEAERQWPQRSAKIVLVIALARLARHYGLAAEARGPERARGLVHWGAEDFRPQLAGTAV